MMRINVNRRCLVFGAALASAVPYSIGQTTSGKKLPKIGFLGAGPKLPRESPFWVQFFGDLEKFGWVEGKNFTFDFRVALGDNGKLDRLAGELLEAGADLILAGSDAEALAAVRAAPKLPVVVAIGADPVAFGYARSLGRPGGTVTGLAWAPGNGIYSRQAQLLKEYMPDLKRLGGVHDIAQLGNAAVVEETKQAVTRIGLTHEVIDVAKAADLEDAYSRMAAMGIRAALIYGSPMGYANMTKMIALARKHRIADSWIFPEAVEGGALMSYGTDLIDLYRRSAGYVDKILRGAKPADLPIELPLKYTLALNLKTGKELGREVPKLLRLQADRIIE